LNDCEKNLLAVSFDLLIRDGRNDQKRTELIAGTIQSLEVDRNIE
jgi:hypothetical protein